MIAVGIGCHSAAGVDDIEAAIDAALGQAALSAEMIGVLASLDRDRVNAVLATVAARRGVGLALLPQAALAAQAEGCVTRSARVIERFGVPSVAEAAALAAAGDGAVLVAPRIVRGGATAAIARGRGEPVMEWS